MNMSRDLTQALHALRSGDREAAKRLLAAALRADPKNAQAWLWMSETADTDERRRECLLRVLALDPDNQAARAGLLRLAEPASRSLETVSPPVDRHDLESAPISARRGRRGAAVPVDASALAHRRRVERYVRLAGGLSLTLLVGLVLLLAALAAIASQPGTQRGRAGESALHEATLWCPSCERQGQPVVLSTRIGASFYQSSRAGGLPHGTRVAVLRYRWAALERRYYALVAAEGKKGWVPETQIRR